MLCMASREKKNPAPKKISSPLPPKISNDPSLIITNDNKLKLKITAVIIYFSKYVTMFENEYSIGVNIEMNFSQFLIQINFRHRLSQSIQIQNIK